MIEYRKLTEIRFVKYMPPTFLIFLGLIVYFGFTFVTLAVFVPMLFVDSKRLFAKKVISTVLISFPCLIVMGIICAIIFIIPALAFSWLANGGNISVKPRLSRSSAQPFVGRLCRRCVAVGSA